MAEEEYGSSLGYTSLHYTVDPDAILPVDQMSEDVRDAALGLRTKSVVLDAEGRIREANRQAELGPDPAPVLSADLPF